MEKKLSVSFNYNGTQQDLDKFFLSIILDYIEKQELIEGDRPEIESIFDKDELNFLA